MGNARIIRLENNVGTSSAPRVASFEEAFGEFSEARGRDRREKRRDARSQSKVAKQQRKGEEKVGHFQSGRSRPKDQGDLISARVGI